MQTADAVDQHHALDYYGLEKTQLLTNYLENSIKALN